jgi:NADH:ubiquinone oxidoreductase subunit 6 (subunit J)
MAVDIHPVVAVTVLGGPIFGTVASLIMALTTRWDEVKREWYFYVGFAITGMFALLIFCIAVPFTLHKYTPDGFVPGRPAPRDRTD